MKKSLEISGRKGDKNLCGTDMHEYRVKINAKTGKS